MATISSSDQLASLVGSRSGLYSCSPRWADALFELCDATLCAQGTVGSIPALNLEPEFTRSHGSLYKALALGSVDEDGLRRLLVSAQPADWPLVFAVDASTWPRCDAETSPKRGSYHSASRHSAASRSWRGGATSG
ncbi:MAG: transposase [Acidimicrobiales bacterium]